MSAVSFDHVAFAVHDAPAVLQRLRADFGAVPITGEQAAQFRYVISHIGTAPGLLVELLDAHGRPDGFLQRFLDHDGEGPHHLTFEVPDLTACLDRLDDLEIPVIQVNLDHPPWQEAFVHPKDAPGILVQIASSTCKYPSVPELLASGVTVEPELMPHIRDGVDRRWWVTDQPASAPIPGRVRGVALTVPDLGRAETLFAEALCAQISPVRDLAARRYRWGELFIDVRPGDPTGLHTVYLDDADSSPKPREIAGTPVIGSRAADH